MSSYHITLTNLERVIDDEGREIYVVTYQGSIDINGFSSLIPELEVGKDTPK